MKLLAAADIHLGRPPARVPADWAERHSPRVAFDKLVTAAIDEQVDAVLLAGDVADRENVFFEAYGVLQRGVARLRGKGIPLIAVAGNHDTHILPELADAVQDPEAFRLLGRGGTWESMDLGCRDGNQIRIWGWSFPRSDYSGNPLSDFPGPGSNRPATAIGLLHADRGGAGGVYAPVSAANLDDSGVRPWILGHIHLPDPTAPGSTSYYPGSLQALDPTETGIHGALRIAGAAAPTFERLRMGGLRYELLSFDVTGIEGQGEMIARLKARISELRQGDATCRAVSVRVNVTGETELQPAEIRRWLAGDDQTREIPMDGDFIVHTERIDLDVRPPLDLDGLARGQYTTAVLARLLQDLESRGESDATADLLAKAEERLRRVDQTTAFSPLSETGDDGGRDESLRLLLQQGYALLREIRRQREAGA